MNPKKRSRGVGLHSHQSIYTKVTVRKQVNEEEQESDPELEFRKQMVEYRNQLVEAEKDAQSSYDKSLVSLSGGGIAISFAFAENFLKESSLHHTEFLLAAWLCWGISVTAVVCSFFFSQRAMESTIRVIDENIDDHEKIRDMAKGGVNTVLVQVFNVFGGICFFLGVVFIICFANDNIKGETNGKQGSVETAQKW